MGPKRILIQNFQYDGTGPDAFFWAGVQGSNPSSDGILLGKKYAFTKMNQRLINFELPNYVELTLINYFASFLLFSSSI